MAGKLRDWARAIKRDAHALYLAARDPRVPWYAKALALCVAAYALSPNVGRPKITCGSPHVRLGPGHHCTTWGEVSELWAVRKVHLPEHRWHPWHSKADRVAYVRSALAVEAKPGSNWIARWQCASARCRRLTLRGLPGSVHTARVLDILSRRAIALLVILALLAGAQMSLMPMAMALPGTDMAGMTSAVDSHDCKDCVLGKMTVADCGAVCAMMVAVVDGMQTSSIIVRYSGWAWSNEPLQLRSPKPDTAPPRF